MEAFNDWLTDLSRISAIAGILYYIFTKGQNTAVGKTVFLILLLSFIADSAIYFFIRLIYPNSFIIGNSWVILNYFLMVWVFYKILNKSHKLCLSLAIVFTIGSVVTFGFIYDYKEANFFTSVFSTISFIALSLITYFQLLQKASERLLLQPVFWIATSFFIYYSLLLLRNVFDSYLIFELNISSEAYTAINIINLFANISKNFILFYALVLIDKGYPDTLKPARAA